MNHQLYTTTWWWIHNKNSERQEVYTCTALNGLGEGFGITYMYMYMYSLQTLEQQQHKALMKWNNTKLCLKNSWNVTKSCRTIKEKLVWGITVHTCTHWGLWTIIQGLKVCWTLLLLMMRAKSLKSYPQFTPLIWHSTFNSICMYRHVVRTYIRTWCINMYTHTKNTNTCIIHVHKYMYMHVHVLSGTT